MRKGETEQIHEYDPEVLINGRLCERIDRVCFLLYETHDASQLKMNQHEEERKKREEKTVVCGFFSL